MIRNPDPDLPLSTQQNTWSSLWSPEWDQQFSSRMSKFLNEANIRRKLELNQLALRIILSEQKMEYCKENTLEWYMAWESFKYNNRRLRAMLKTESDIGVFSQL